MELKKAKIEGIEIFKIEKAVFNDLEVEKVARENRETTKTMQELVRGMKSGKVNLFVTDHDGNAYQGITFSFNNEVLAGIAPNLVQAYFDLAYGHIQWTNSYKETLFQTASKEFDPVKIVPEAMFQRFIQYRLTGIVFLHLTVEAFLNNIIPDSHIYEKKEVSNHDKFLEVITKYNKKQIERWLSFKEKLDDVLFSIPDLNINSEIFKPIREKLIELSQIRDEIVHLKSKANETKSYYEKIFSFITNKDLNKYVLAVQDFLNLVRPNFIQIETLVDNRASYEITVEKPEYLNFGLLIEVVRMKFELIKVNILKTENFSEFASEREFLFRHFKLLEKMNCITDYQIQEFNDRIIIEFYKNEQQLK